MTQPINKLVNGEGYAAEQSNQDFCEHLEGVLLVSNCP
jgi:hypothetical protein